MKHLLTYKIYESDNVCTTCNGTGEVDREINMWVKWVDMSARIVMELVN